LRHRPIGFYSKSCPKAESIIRSTVKKHFATRPFIAPAWLRLHFHDCFIRGCDASNLIDGPGTERQTPLNQNIPAFDVIDDAKAQLEAECPGIVSCADILALGARDSVILTKGISWEVPTGRRDGKISLASDTQALTGFRDPVQVQMKKFAEKGLDTQDFVALLERFLSNQNTNYSNTGRPDPSIDPEFLPQLQKLCPKEGNGTNRVGLDFYSPTKFDSVFYDSIIKERGILAVEQQMLSENSTRPYVHRFTNTSLFKEQFGRSMVKMSNIDVKTGNDGVKLEKFALLLINEK
ncbi:hem peroxidase, partial [Dillenia turbinata]